MCLVSVLEQQFLHRVGDLLAAAVADRDVDLHAVAVLGTGGRGLEAARHLGRQQLQRADHAQAPWVTRARQLVDDVHDDLEQRLDLPLGAAEIVGGQQPKRYDFDVRLSAPRQEVGDLLRAGAVAVRDIGEPGFASPTTVAVQHDRDMARMATGGLLHQPLPVGAVQDSGHERPKTHVGSAYAA